VLCPQCRDNPPQVDGLRAGGLPGGPLRQAIHAFKYTARTCLLLPWARYSPAPIIAMGSLLICSSLFLCTLPGTASEASTSPACWREAIRADAPAG